jgi:hypothetical protein
LLKTMPKRWKNKKLRQPPSKLPLIRLNKDYSNPQNYSLKSLKAINLIARGRAKATPLFCLKDVPTLKESNKFC